MEILVYERRKRQKKGCSITVTAASKSKSKSKSKFMSIVNVSDDLLLEIFLRLPNFRSVVECASVCKRWFSLISHSMEYFHLRKRLVLQHQNQYSQPLPFTLLVRGQYYVSGLSPMPPKNRRLKFPRQPRYDFFSDRCKSLHYGHRQGSLDSLLPGYTFIWSSFQDLLLVQKAWTDFYLCNPFSGQCVALPKPPPTKLFNNAQIYRCGFVCEPYKYDTYKYRVVKIAANTNGWDDQLSDRLRLAIFSSETGRWRKSTLSFPMCELVDWHLIPVGNDGIIYWPFGRDGKLQGIFALDPFKDDSESERYWVIGMPLGFGRDWRCKAWRVRLGVVRGKLRLSQFFWAKKSGSFVLKAWDLDAKTRSWDLAHHVKDRISFSFDACLLLIALHPDDGDVFFFSCFHFDRDVRNPIELCQYQIGKQNFETLCQFPAVVGVHNRFGLLVFPLLHPWWPTTMPELPYS